MNRPIVSLVCLPVVKFFINRYAPGNKRKVSLTQTDTDDDDEDSTSFDSRPSKKK